MATRLILALLAVAVAGWAALTLRSLDDVDQGVLAMAQSADRPARYDDAVDAFGRARRFRPDADIDVRQGAAALLADQPLQRVTAPLLRAVDAEPDNVDAWVTLARAYLVAGRESEARRAQRRAVKLDPRFGEGR